MNICFQLDNYKHLTFLNLLLKLYIDGPLIAIESNEDIKMVIDLTSTSSQSMARSKVSTLPTAEAESTAAATKQPVPKDTFEPSDTALALKKADDTIANSPEVDQERVANIKAAIADGSYKIDYTSVAEKLLGFEAQLG